ncbi:cytochrome c [Phototrophicus methaneseepsis]|uniref:Cytochrome c n=1 Tax=Phototrophicus methaneseepsis TaxID=2710758 RepID=A0A7S8EAC3_9CHLR|nr:c-type cytochrome [Phototrophicus methaneseepsis]QPC83317.1 cytochrome c [Phototrophicus methaneseepsis]
MMMPQIRTKQFKIRTLILLLALISLMVPTLAQDEDEGPQATGGQPWDLKEATQDGLFIFYDAPAGASTTGKPVDVGDFDGDGCGDLAITGQNAAHALDGVWRGSAGHVRIVMNLCNITGQIAIDDVPADQTVFTIFGAYAGDMAGTETYIADFNNDGYDDLLFSAQNSDGPVQQRSNAGAAYVLFGSEDFAEHGDIDLRTLPEDVIVFYGASAEDRLGLWVEGGDFDGDGYHDVLVGANQADGLNNERINAGEVWILYGSEDMAETYGQVTDLAEPPEDATRIIGADYDDLMGSCVWGADLNGDGYDDAIVSAGLWRASSGVGGLSFGGADGPANQRYNSGESFVIFGGEDLRGQVIDLAEKIDETGAPIDDSVTVIYGADANDLLGEEIATGDMDGDGIYDLILGTLVGDGAENNLDEAGEAWIIYTHAPFEGQMFDLADVDPARAVVIFPDQADSKAGDTLRVDDIDGDGIADMFYGAPDYDATGYDGVLRPNTGMLAVIFGEEGGIPHDDGRILLFDPPADLRVKVIIGPEANDMMPYALAIYDVDGDGVIDIIPNAMGGDGAHNDQVNAGEIFVINGAEFLSDAHSYQVTAPEADPDATPASTTEVTSAYATATPHLEATAVTSNVGDVEQGQRNYEETCAGCHGFTGEGVPGLGLPLVTSPLVLYASDADLLAFLREGRPADHPDNTVGISMPASGGRPDWTDEDLMDVIAYLRQMRDEYDD